MTTMYSRAFILMVWVVTLANFWYTQFAHRNVFVREDDTKAISIDFPDSRPPGGTSLQSTSTSTSTDDPCSLEISSNETFWFAVAAWNYPEGLHRALESVRRQSNTGYGKLHVVVMEDLSDNMFTPEDEARYNQAGSHMQVSFLRKSLGTQKLGSAGGKWVAFEFIKKHALPHEYVFVLDGDDLLPDKDTVSYIHQRLSTTKPWFAWGRHIGKWSNQCHDLQASSTRKVRTIQFCFCHPRIFVAHLLQQHFVIEDLQTPSGEWLQKSTDAAFIYKFLEVSGKSRIQYLGDERPLYKYIVTKANGMKVFNRDVVRAAKELVKRRKPAHEAVDTIHVVIACGASGDAQQKPQFLLQSLVASQLPSHNSNVHYSIHIICGGDGTSLLQQQEIPMHMSLTIHDNTNSDHHGRLSVAQELVQSQYVDYVILLDVNNVVQPQTLAKIYEARKPKTYKTTTNPNPNPPAVGGISIVDASIFGSLEVVQKQPTGISDDMWLSHVAKQMLGWNVESMELGGLMIESQQQQQLQQRQLTRQEESFQIATQQCVAASATNQQT